MPYTGGQPLYRERCQAVVDAGYEGFEVQRLTPVAESRKE